VHLGCRAAVTITLQLREPGGGAAIVGDVVAVVVSAVAELVRLRVNARIGVVTVAVRGTPAVVVLVHNACGEERGEQEQEPGMRSGRAPSGTGGMK